jgi:hypothetical protein
MRRSPPDPPAESGPRGRGATIERKDAEAVDSRVEQLARELAEAINEAEGGGRVEMRDYAIDVLRDSVGSEVAEAGDARSTLEKKPPLNPFALGIPMLLIGVVLAFIFTPVGVALLALGSITCLIGLVMAVFRSTRDRWRARGDVQ